MFIKICGITNVDDALLAAGLGADAVGLVFASSSRQITTETARDIVRSLPPEVLSVGVFRNEVRKSVVEIANKVGCRAVQLHGVESPEDTKWVASRVPSVIRAFSSTNTAVQKFEAYSPARLLIDSSSPGSGQTSNWGKLEKLKIVEPYILAGGLSPDNVASAVHRLRPWGVDVSTGVEDRPGHKDAVKVRRFINEARSIKTKPESKTEERKPFDWEEDGTW